MQLAHHRTGNYRAQTAIREMGNNFGAKIELGIRRSQVLFARLPDQ